MCALCIPGNFISFPPFTHKTSVWYFYTAFICCRSPWTETLLREKFNLIVSLKKFQFTNNFFFLLLLHKHNWRKNLPFWRHLLFLPVLLFFSLFLVLFRMTVVFSQEQRVYLSACVSSAFFMIFLRKRRKWITFLCIRCIKQFLVDRAETFHFSLFNKTLKNQLHCECEHFFRVGAIFLKKIVGVVLFVHFMLGN